MPGNFHSCIQRRILAFNIGYQGADFGFFKTEEVGNDAFLAYFLLHNVAGSTD